MAAPAKPLPEAYALQSEIGEEIKRFYKNYPKLSTADRANLAVVSSKINRVLDLVHQFRQNHEAIIASGGSNADEYFKIEYYDLIMKKHEDEIQRLVADKEKIESKIPKVDESLLPGQLKDQNTPTIQVTAPSGSGVIPNTPIHPKTPTLEESSVVPSKNEVLKAVKGQLVCMTMLDEKMKKITSRLQHGIEGPLIELQVEDLHHQWNKVVEYHRRILMLSDEQVLESGYKLETFSRMEDEVEALIATLISRQRSDLENSANDSNHLQERTHTVATNSDVGMAIGMIHLPKVEIPLFHGSYEEWLGFKKLFEDMIHSQTKITDSQKLFYLKSAMKGDALSLKTAMTINMDNYEGAYNRLKDKFDNEQVLTTVLLKKMINQDFVEEKSSKGLRDLKDVSINCINSLKGLKVDVSGCEPLIVFLLIQKLDPKTREVFTFQQKSPKQNPTLTNFFDFLERRAQSLESMGTGKAVVTGKGKSNSRTSHATTSETDSSTKTICVCCKEKHSLSDCKKFKDFDNRNQFNFVFKRKICCRCLISGHKATSCSKPLCPIDNCGKNHHPLLHRTDKRKGQESGKKVSSLHANKTDLRCESLGVDKFVFLGTAVLNVKDSFGVQVNCRALLDSCSQVNIISLKMCRKLNCRLMSSSTDICGVDSGRATSNSKVIVEISSLDSSFKASIDAVVLSKVSTYSPLEEIDLGPLDLSLADPDFNKPDSVDLLLGSDVYSKIVKDGVKSLGNGLPDLLNSVFGWVVLGSYARGSHQASPFCGVSAQEADFYLNAPKLWEMEECWSSKPPLSPDDQRVESLFSSTTTRAKDGKFIVALPKVENAIPLGNSFKSAYRRFLNLERRFSRDPALFERYYNFLNEYLQLDHMVKTTKEEIPEDHYYLPHHAVFKEDSSTTKIRVVFDGSCKSDSKRSLNDNLLKGPTLQDDIFDLLLRFRTHRFVVCADIAKMFRQIWVSKADQFYQLILWRNKPSHPISIYRLKTVTYGTKPATYLSTKCLQSLASENQEKYPESSQVLLKDMYVDDLITGANSVEEILKLQKELVHILSEGGFHLRKWAANDSRLLDKIPDDDKEFRWPGENDINDHVKTLGIIWKPLNDTFSLVVQQLPTRTVVTKRVVCAEAGSVYDPLGFVSPFLVKAKILIQEIWKRKLDWDQELPKELSERWNSLRSDMVNLKELEVDRFVSSDSCQSIELHGFSDASKAAYGGVVYVRSISDKGFISIKLLASRSRVAPLRETSIPRLELAAAKVLVELMMKVVSSLRCEIKTIHYWSDSQVVLWWLRKPSSSFKPFVANRVSFIQENSKVNNWHYVPSEQNPADIVSRGASVLDLLNSSIWFTGPQFLSLPCEYWPKQNVGFELTSENPECEFRKNAVVMLMSREEFDSCNMFEVNHRNSFHTLQRIVGFVCRFIRNCGKNKIDPSTKKETFKKLLNENLDRETILKIVPSLSVDELDNSLKNIVRYLQKSLCDIKTNKALYGKLLPFRDNENILRVGGRLKNACIPFDAKHQMLLPKCKITLMLLRDIHWDNDHVPPQTLLSITRQKYWPVSGAKSCSKVFFHCVRCFKTRPRDIQQIMGNLPQTRTELIAPFAHTGVDYAGPFRVHYTVRGKKPTKAYVAVFVCFSVKAVHLELVSDLTTNAFYACFKRFIARRGKPISMHSDNATNFMGCKEDLRRLSEFLEKHSNSFSQFAANRGIKWEPIPPGSPHFGGLWESSVKRMKYHLVHILKDRKLTFEELNTVLIEIEAILNSRPLTVQSENPADLKPLTPNNFLIPGDAHLLPERDLSNVKPQLLRRWDVISKIRQEYWSRLALEYFHTLQDRAKWLKLFDNLQTNTVVLLKNANTPPTQWEMGLVTEVIKGNDDVVRVVDVKTSLGTKRRAITQVCPFPPLDENSMFTWENANSKDSDSEMQVSKSKSPTRGISKKTSISQILTTILCMFLIIPLCFAENPVNVTKFSNHPGIFFDGIGKVNIVNNEWHILMYYNLTSYWQQCKNFDMYVSRIKTLCENQACQHVINQLSTKVKVIEDFNVLIKQECQMREHLRSYSEHKRVSRSYKAPLDVFGSFAFRWFGTLDSNYADKVETALANAKNNEDRLLMLVKNQTTIIDNTVNIMKSNNKEVENKLYQLHNDTAYLKELLKLQAKNILFNTMTSNLLMVLSNYREIQDQIHETLKDFKKGKLNPLLVNPHELEEHLVKLQDTLGMKFKLPTVRFSELETIVQMATVFGTNCLIFQIEIPLLKSLDHDLYQMIPVPTFSKGVFTFLKPLRQFLAINLQEQTYYFMSIEEFEKCVEFYEIKICRQQHVMFHINEDNHCEVNFFLHQAELTTQCDVRTSRQNHFWIELHKTNQWLFALRSTHRLKVICDGDTPFQSLQIEGEGILQLSPQCNVIVNGVEISGKSVKYSSLFLKTIPPVLPDFNITDDIPIKDSKIPFVVSLQNLDSISEDIEKLKIEENVTLKSVEIINDYSWEMPSTYHVISFSMTGMLLTLVISLFVYIKCCRKNQKKVKVQVQTGGQHQFNTTDL